MHGKKERGFLLKIIWQSSKERYFWMIFIVLLSVIPKFINVYGIKIIIDLITRQASFADIVFAMQYAWGKVNLDFMQNIMAISHASDILMLPVQDPCGKLMQRS